MVFLFRLDLSRRIGGQRPSVGAVCQGALVGFVVDRKVRGARPFRAAAGDPAGVIIELLLEYFTGNKPLIHLFFRGIIEDLVLGGRLRVGFGLAFRGVNPLSERQSN